MGWGSRADLDDARRELREAETQLEQAQRDRSSRRVQEDLEVRVDEAAAAVRKQVRKWEWS